MKFGRKLQREAHPKYRHYYIAYNDLKKAIKLITGSETSSYTIAEVTSNFGNIQALSGSIYRPPEARFQDLLNHELEKINHFSTVTFAAIVGALRQILKQFRDEGAATEKALEELDREIDRQADDIVFLDSYQRLTFTGFRKITKKCDKHNKSASATWYMARLVKEPFMTLDFSYILRLLSVCYEELRRHKERVMRGDASEATADKEGQAGGEAEKQPKGSQHTATSLRHESGQEQRPSSSFADEASHDGFQERSTKYLVQVEDLMRVKVLILRHVPLAAIGSTRSDQARLLREIHDPLTSITRSWATPPGTTSATTVSPAAHDGGDEASGRRGGTGTIGSCMVYFDSLDFKQYKEVLTKRKSQRAAAASGQTQTARGLLRFRWQGVNDGDPDLQIFVERVDPSESALEMSEWPDVTATDLLRREGTHDFAVVKQKHIPQLLDGTLGLDALLEKKTRLLSQERVANVREFLTGVMNELKTTSMVPCVQAWCQRTSFRCAPVPSIGINIDESVRYVSELAQHPDQKEGWISHSTEALVGERAKSFPYAILDVSVSSSSIKSNFLQDVTGLSSVTEVWGFSNFVHSMALMNRSRVPQLPHWFQFTTQTDAEGIPAQEDEEGQLPLSDSSGIAAPVDGREKGDNTPGVRVDVIRQDASSRLRHEHYALSIHQEASGRYDDFDDIFESSQCGEGLPLPPPPNLPTGPMRSDNRPVGGGGGGARNYSPLGEPLLDRLAGDPSCLRLSVVGMGDGGVRQLVTKPPMASSTPSGAAGYPTRNFQAAGGPAIGGTPAAWLASGWSFLLSLWRSNTFVTPEPQRGDASAAAAVRVEPKTFFANERTLLQWMNTAVLLSTIAITLINFGTPSGRVAGLILSPVALFFIVYPFAVYLRRSHSLERKEPINYNDRLGPTILVVCLVLALSTVIILNLVGHVK